MMKKGKLLFLFLLLIFLTPDCFAQIGWDSLIIKSKSRVFLSLAFSCSPDVEQSPYKVTANYQTVYNYSSSTPTYLIVPEGNMGMRQLTTNFESAGIKFRYNLMQFSPISSISLSCNPTIGLGFSILEQSPPTNGGGTSGFGSINVPLFIEYSYGGGATHNTQEEYGLFGCAGIEFTKAPLIQRSLPAQVMMDANGNGYYTNLINAWFEPVAGFGIRYHDRKNRLREVYLKYGMRESKLFIGPNGYDADSGFPWTLKLTFVREI